MLINDLQAKAGYDMHKDVITVPYTAIHSMAL